MIAPVFPELIAISRYSLTPEDQAIFSRLTDSRTQGRYSWADQHALIRAGAALRAFGSIVDCVRTMEIAQRRIEERLR